MSFIPSKSDSGTFHASNELSSIKKQIADIEKRIPISKKKDFKDVEILKREAMIQIKSSNNRQLLDRQPKIGQLMAQNSKLEEMIIQMKENSEKLQRELDVYRESSLAIENNELQTKISSLKSQNEQLQHKIYDYQSILRSYVLKDSVYHDNSEQLNALQQRAEEEKRKNESRILELKKALSKVLRCYKSEQKKRMKAQEEKIKLTKEIDSKHFDGKLKEYEKRIKDLLEENEKLKGGMKKFSQDRERMISLEEQFDKLQREFKESKELGCTGPKKVVNDDNNSYNHSERSVELDISNDSGGKVGSTSSSKKSERLESLGVPQPEQCSSSSVSKLSSSCSKKSDSTVQLRVPENNDAFSFSSHPSTESERTTLRNRVNALSQENEELRNENGELQNKIKEMLMEQVRDSIESTEQIQNDKIELDKGLYTLDQLIEENKQLKEKVSLLESKQPKVNIHSALEELSSIRSANSKLKSRIDELEGTNSKLAHIQDQLDSALRSKAELAKKIQELENNNEYAYVDVRGLFEQIQSLTSELNYYRNKDNSPEKNDDPLLDILEKHRNHGVQSPSKYNEKEKYIESLKNDNINLVTENHMLRSKLAKYEEEDEDAAQVEIVASIDEEIEEQTVKLPSHMRDVLCEPKERVPGSPTASKGGSEYSQSKRSLDDISDQDRVFDTVGDRISQFKSEKSDNLDAYFSKIGDEEEDAPANSLISYTMSDRLLGDENAILYTDGKNRTNSSSLGRELFEESSYEEALHVNSSNTGFKNADLGMINDMGKIQSLNVNLESDTGIDNSRALDGSVGLGSDGGSNSIISNNSVRSGASSKSSNSGFINKNKDLGSSAGLDSKADLMMDMNFELARPTSKDSESYNVNFSKEGIKDDDTETHDNVSLGANRESGGRSLGSSFDSEEERNTHKNTELANNDIHNKSSSSVRDSSTTFVDGDLDSPNDEMLKSLNPGTSSQQKSSMISGRSSGSNKSVSVVINDSSEVLNSPVRTSHGANSSVIYDGNDSIDRNKDVFTSVYASDDLSRPGAHSNDSKFSPNEDSNMNSASNRVFGYGRSLFSPNFSSNDESNRTYPQNRLSDSSDDSSRSRRSFGIVRSLNEDNSDRTSDRSRMSEAHPSDDTARSAGSSRSALYSRGTFVTDYGLFEGQDRSSTHSMVSVSNSAVKSDMSAESDINSNNSSLYATDENMKSSESKKDTDTVGGSQISVPQVTVGFDREYESAENKVLANDTIASRSSEMSDRLNDTNHDITEEFNKSFTSHSNEDLDKSAILHESIYPNESLLKTSSAIGDTSNISTESMGSFGVKNDSPKEFISKGFSNSAHIEYSVAALEEEETDIEVTDHSNYEDPIPNDGKAFDYFLKNIDNVDEKIQKYESPIHARIIKDDRYVDDFEDEDNNRVSPKSPKSLFNVLDDESDEEEEIQDNIHTVFVMKTRFHESSKSSNGDTKSKEERTFSDDFEEINVHNEERSSKSNFSSEKVEEDEGMKELKKFEADSYSEEFKGPVTTNLSSNNHILDGYTRLNNESDELGDDETLENRGFEKMQSENTDKYSRASEFLDSENVSGKDDVADIARSEDNSKIEVRKMINQHLTEPDEFISNSDEHTVPELNSRRMFPYNPFPVTPQNIRAAMRKLSDNLYSDPDELIATGFPSSPQLENDDDNFSSDDDGFRIEDPSGGVSTINVGDTSLSSPIHFSRRDYLDPFESFIRSQGTKNEKEFGLDIIERDSAETTREIDSDDLRIQKIINEETKSLRQSGREIDFHVGFASSPLFESRHDDSDSDLLTRVKYNEDDKSPSDNEIDLEGIRTSGEGHGLMDNKGPADYDEEESYFDNAVALVAEKPGKETEEEDNDQIVDTNTHSVPVELSSPITPGAQTVISQVTPPTPFTPIIGRSDSLSVVTPKPARSDYSASDDDYTSGSNATAATTSTTTNSVLDAMTVSSKDSDKKVSVQGYEDSVSNATEEEDSSGNFRPRQYTDSVLADIVSRYQNSLERAGIPIEGRNREEVDELASAILNSDEPSSDLDSRLIVENHNLLEQIHQTQRQLDETSSDNDD